MEGILPPEIQWRTTKANLSPNFHRRFRDVDLAESGQIDEASLSRYVRIDRLREMLAHQRSQASGDNAKAETLTLFRATILAEWLESLTSNIQPTRQQAGAPSPVAA